MKLTPYNFFLRHAGYSYDPKTETKGQARNAGALALANAEWEAHSNGFSYNWTIDTHIDSSDFSDEQPSWQLWQCAMFNADGGIVNSLHGIDFGRDGAPWDPYRRVVEAELAIDGLTNSPQ